MFELIFNSYFTPVVTSLKVMLFSGYYHSAMHPFPLAFALSQAAAVVKLLC
jgi:hypothetical protein